jgi:hypothetical protein
MIWVYIRLSKDGKMGYTVYRYTFYRNGHLNRQFDKELGFWGILFSDRPRHRGFRECFFSEHEQDMRGTCGET